MAYDFQLTHSAFDMPPLRQYSPPPERVDCSLSEQFVEFVEGGPRLKSPHRVLIIDESTESRDVLRMLLERHGATTMESRRPDHAVQLAERFRPHLIVLDAESDHSAAGNATNDLCAAAGRTDTPIVILGTVRRPGDALANGQIVDKPYHYGQLIHKIEGLLAAA